MKPKLRHYIDFAWNNIYQNESNFLGSIPTESENACNRWPQVYEKAGNKEWKHSLEVFKMGSHKCKTTAITRENDLISSRNEHTDEVFPGRLDARLLVQKMKHDTKIQQVPVNSIIIANGLQSVSEEKAVQLALPCLSAIKWALNRQKVNDRPTLPPIVDRHFEVPKQHEDFCVFDSGIEDPERVLIFGDRDSIQSLILHRDVWLCDRTFKVCPIQFNFTPSTFNSLDFTPPPPLHLCTVAEQNRTHLQKVTEGVISHHRKHRASPHSPRFWTCSTERFRLSSYRSVA